MGLSKSEIFTEHQNQIASICKLFSNPARIAILDYLFKLDSCYSGSIVEEIGLAQPTVSLHLKELKRMGLVQGTIEGKNICYCIHKENWDKMKAVMESFLYQDIHNSECC